MASNPRRPVAAPGTDVDVGLPPDNLTDVVAGGMLWKALTRVVSAVTRVAVVVVLARLLTPDDYGVAAMALVVTRFALIFTDPGLGAALIQRPTITERDRSTVFWLSAVIGVALGVLGIMGAGLVADFFGEPQVRDMVIVTSLCITLTSLSVAPRALLARRLAYRSLEIREMVSIVVGGAVAIAFAIAGFGPWAVISNYVAATLMSTLLVWLVLDWRPRGSFSRDSARGLAGFSSSIWGSNVLSWASSNLDKVLVGRVLGAPALGAYSLAYTAMRLPNELVARPFQQVLSPAYARIQQDHERLERAWLRSKRVSVALVSPLLVGLIVVAPDFIRVVFGAKWEDAIVPLQLLCLGGLANSQSSLHWSLLQARGSAGTLLRITLASAAVTFAAVIVGVQWGIVGVAAFYAGSRWLLVGPTLLITARAVGFEFSKVLAAGAAAFPLSLCAGAVAYAVREGLLAAGTPAVVRLVVVGLVMAGVYGALLFAFAPALVDDVRRVFADRLRVWQRKSGDAGGRDSALADLG